MNIFVKAVPAKKAKTVESQKAAYAYAAVLTVFVLAQLFTFDKFLSLLESFSLPGGNPVAHLFGSVLVASEVLALPFLLCLKLSPLMRIFSMFLGWLVPFIWLLLSLWILFTVNTIMNIGFLGTVVNMIPGWWVVFICIAMGLLAAWASWGLWPMHRNKIHE